MSHTLVRWQDLTPTPWKNGGGVTRRLAAAPASATFEDIDWSVSIADIEKDGPFSGFTGIDRVLMLIGGTELILDVDGAVHGLGVLDRLAFSGEATTSCRVPAGPARALNLMTRRGRASGTARAVDVTGACGVTVREGEAAVLVVLAGELTLGMGTCTGAEIGAALNVLDGIVADVPTTIEVAGTGLLAELRIEIETY
ncbi:environmental stress-induced protein Ves [Catenulispora sp. GP43]|uniref:HutD/Ves family protein n=1 Tax=Catenulispora sp. GP43 TaxID=3156263 RepID=UPI003514E435